MSRALALGDLAAIVSGTVFGDTTEVVVGITTDSRTASAGDAFVAVVGETHNGHDFVGRALEAGAVGVIVHRGTTGVEPRIEVDDTFTALRDIAAARRIEIEVPVVAVTGSTGKTTTKDMLAAALPQAWASPRSYNNEIGVPLTILGTPRSARHVVVEVGSRGTGQIAWLMPAIRPAVAVITNLGVVHVATFGTEAALADAKWELVEGLGADGVAVLPAAEPRLARPHAGSTVTFGVDEEADVAAVDVEVDLDGIPSFTLVTKLGSLRARVPLPGRHQAANAAAAVAAGLSLGVDLDVLVGGLENATGSPWRMEIHRGAYTVVNDAYNANPDSVEAALRTVAELPGRHIAVLGHMAELGNVAKREHLRIGALASSLGYAAVVTVGAEPGIATGAGAIARNVPDADAAERVLSDFLRSGDVVLVKASRAVGLEALAHRLAEEATP